MTDAIETHGLTKDYGSRRGIFDLDLTVRDGEVFGFLGPNGAGKTTTIRQLMGLIRPTRGSARIFGLDCDRDSVAVKRKVGYCPGELPQFGGWRGAEIVSYVAGLRGDVEDAAIKALAERLDLDLGRKYREYSHGNKQKLALVLAFMHQPLLVILDEPTSGLDPLVQQEFYGIVRDARAGGATIFVSSHVLSEVEHICDRVAIVREGRLATVSKLDDLVGMRAFHVEIEFADGVPTEQLRDVQGLEQLRVEDRRASALLRGSFEPLMTALAGRRVVGLTSREPSLEEIFLTYYEAKR
ncbi:MAG TPA: ABC transporter ATP-binding protein [Candidatus Limnocylindria bacterium]|jgi:ABC-2 type transport system ATP-binding protein|nr:ABC transporter ATP-binding protein [Candidatus Limnocylindria bacterium]